MTGVPAEKREAPGGQRRGLVLPLWIATGVLLFGISGLAPAQDQQNPDPRTVIEPEVHLASDQPADQRDSLNLYLRRFQLVDLLVDHFENQLIDETEPLRRRSIARELSELYGLKLETRPEEFDSVLELWDKMVAGSPDAIDTSGQLAIALGHYRRARDSFDRWFWEADRQIRRDDVVQQFETVVDRAEALLRLEHSQRAGINESVDAQPVEADPPDEALILGDQKPAPAPLEAIPSLTVPDQVSLQARFVLGWSLYLLAIVEQNPANRDIRLIRAKKLFGELLQIPAGTEITALRPDWFEPGSRWSCRVLNGMGMVCQATGDTESARYCFALLGDPRVPSDLRLRHRVHQFQSMVQAGAVDQAAALVTNWASRPPDATIDRNLWFTVAQAGLGLRIEPGAEVDYDLLTVTGLAELGKQNDWTSIDRLLDRSNRSVTGGGFLADWLKGYQHLRRATIGSANIEDRQASLEMAAPLLESAVKLAYGNNPGLTDSQQFKMRARCRYHFGYTLFYLDQFESAFRQFQQAQAVLDHTDPVTGEDCHWMQCQSLEGMSTDQPEWNRALLSAIETFQQKYPDSIRNSDAGFTRMLVQLETIGPMQALESLRAIPADTAGYPDRVLETCRLAHRAWKRSASNPDQNEAMAQAVLDTAEMLRALESQPDDPASGFSLARVCLWAADVLVHRREPNPVQASHWLACCHESIAIESLDTSVQAEYRFLELVTGRLLNKPDQTRFAAGWLARHASRPEHRRAGLRALADDGELELIRIGQEPDSTAPLQTMRRQLVGWYEQILQLHDTAQTVLDDPGLIHCLDRLAHLQLDTGRYAEALDDFTKLTGIDPHCYAWLLGQARSATHLGQWDRASKYWQRIAAGKPAGDPGWLEAKYHLAVCLTELKSPVSIQVVQQTELLVPEMPSPWKQRFDDLRSRQELFSERGD